MKEKYTIIDDIQERVNMVTQRKWEMNGCHNLYKNNHLPKKDSKLDQKPRG